MMVEIDIDTNIERLDKELVYNFLHHHSHWARGIPYDVFQRSLRNSLCFAAYLKDSHQQISFARVISDYATFAYLADVFVLPEFRQKGVCSRVVEAIVKYPKLQDLRRFLLFTTNEQQFYARFGFREPHQAQNFMERYNTRLYKKEK